MEVEIKSWLQDVLKEKIENFTVQILGNSEKGDGYVGDIFFVSLIPIDGKLSKVYSLVLKISKRSEVLRKTTPVREAFINEMYIYETLLPAFTQFQLEKGVLDPFDTVPKCYGTLANENIEVIVFENSRKSGFNLWDKKQPLTRKHINLLMEGYAKFHSISIAMQDQQPEKFEELRAGLTEVFERFPDVTDTKTMFGTIIEEICDVLADDFDADLLKTWRSFKEQIDFIFGDFVNKTSGVKVIIHGDCWSNNFMFKHDIEDDSLKVAVLDWQISRYTSPILDLSYFLFSCISKEDIEELDDILEEYYNNLEAFSKRLGSDLSALYPKRQFLEDWKKYCRFGVMMACLILKICATEKDEVMDLSQAAESCQDFGAAFTFEIKNKTVFKNRTEHVVKYVVENGLIL